MEELIFLDTHVAVWLYAGELERFPPQVLADLEQEELCVSPIVLLEIQYLYETGRISVCAEEVMKELARAIGLKIHQAPFAQVAAEALRHTWTRDPFDRIITAQAGLGRHRLLTKDRIIQAHYSRAYWD